MMEPNPVDWVAKAIAKYRYNRGFQWEDMHENEREFIRGEARAAIKAYEETLK